jgi:hypothetical protein
MKQHLVGTRFRLSAVDQRPQKVTCSARRSRGGGHHRLDGHRPGLGTPFDMHLDGAQLPQQPANCAYC